MSENKLNFSALKTKNTDNKREEIRQNSPPVEIKKEEIKNKPIVQVSLWKKKEVILWAHKKIGSIKESKDKKLDLGASIKVDKLEEKEEIWSKKIVKEPENLFNNYESDFSTKQDSIIDKLKKLKNLPKTRPKLVYSMLWIMVIWVSGLVFISPDNSILKANILWIEQKQEQNINNIDLSKIAKEKAEKLKADELIKNELKKEQEKKKKEKLEKFLLNVNNENNNNNNEVPDNKELIQNIKSQKLKNLLLESKENK